MYKTSPHATSVSHDLLRAAECFANICVTLRSQSSNQSQGAITPVTVLPVTEWRPLQGTVCLDSRGQVSGKESKGLLSETELEGIVCVHALCQEGP